MAIYNRSSKRHNVLHLGYLELKYKNDYFKLIDISNGGISIYLDGVIKNLEKDDMICEAVVRLGSLELTVDIQAVFLDEQERICSFKVKKYYKDSEKLFLNLLGGLDFEGRIDFHHDNNQWSLKTNKIAIEYSNNDITVIKKPFLMKQELLLINAVGLISSLDRNKYPLVDIINIIFDKIKKKY
jgi:hypothetical protein